jgi:hypothetical protein
MTGTRNGSILVLPENLALCLTVGHDGIAYRPVHTEV